jgi:hypothetical protein
MKPQRKVDVNVRVMGERPDKVLIAIHNGLHAAGIEPRQCCVQVTTQGFQPTKEAT